MARLVLTTQGTLGDTLPLIGLGCLLQQRGHDVLMALNRRMHAQARRCGLPCVANGRDGLGPEEARRNASDWNHLNQERMFSDQAFGLAMERMFTQSVPALLEHGRDAQLIIATPQQQLVAQLVAERLEIPILVASVIPFLHCVELSAEARAHARERNRVRDQLLRDRWLQARQEWALPPDDDPNDLAIRTPLLLGSSVHFSRPVGRSAHALQTGFWFHADPGWLNWQPSPELRGFMEQDPAPLVLSFSSQPLEDARGILAVHVRAAALLGRPILIQQGWADFRPELLPDDCDRAGIRFEGFLPQDWLFRRAGALIHHGGIGTTARALRNDCPMLVEPFGNDQFFNARQILALGLGAAMHPQRLRQEAVAEVLERRVLTAQIRRNVTAMGAAIRAERGLQLAADHLETLLP